MPFLIHKPINNFRRFSEEQGIRGTNPIAKKPNLAPCLVSLVFSMMLFFCDQSFASETKAVAQPSKSREQITDSDLKLSIAELKKKYPISLLDEKKKNYKEGQKINIDDYSIAEIKATFLNADENFVSRKRIEGRSVKVGEGAILVDDEVTVKNQQEVIIIEKACDKLAHSDWAKLNKKWNNLFSFIFSDRLPISYYAIKYIPQEVASCLDSIEEARGL